MPEGLPRSVSVNEVAIEEIRDLDNTVLREALEAANVLRQGDAVTADDFEAIKSRTAVLARERQEPVSTEALLTAAFIDRMKHLGQLSDQTIKEMPNEAIYAYLYAETGIRIDDESIEGLRRSELDIESWLKARLAVQKNVVRDTMVAVDEQGTVLARGATPEEAMLRAQEEKEG